MPSIFLSDEAREILKEALGKDIDSIKEEIRVKEAVWKSLCDKAVAPEIPGHGRIVPQEMEKIPDALKDLAKQAMDEHNHVHVEPGGDDGRCKAQTKSQAEIINPVPQSSDSSASGSHEAKKLEPLNLTKADLTIPKFPHDRGLEKSFRTLFYFELPDGRVVLKSSISDAENVSQKFRPNCESGYGN